jgi:hypothetical protein
VWSPFYRTVRTELPIVNRSITQRFSEIRQKTKGNQSWGRI